MQLSETAAGARRLQWGPRVDPHMARARVRAWTEWYELIPPSLSRITSCGGPARIRARHLHGDQNAKPYSPVHTAYCCCAYTRHRITPFPASQRRVPQQTTMVRRFDSALPARHAVVTRPNAYFPRHSSAGVRRGRLYHRCPRYVCLHWSPDRHLDARRARSRTAGFGTGPQCARWNRGVPLALE